MDVLIERFQVHVYTGGTRQRAENDQNKMQEHLYVIYMLSSGGGGVSGMMGSGWAEFQG